MNEITINGKTYILKSSVIDLKREIMALNAQLQNRKEDII